MTPSSPLPHGRTLPPVAIAAGLLLLAFLTLAACAPGTAPSASGGIEPSVPPSMAVPGLPATWSQEGEASWYGPNFVGRPTANGETFDPRRLTAAHRTLPFDTRLRVVNLDTGRSVVVRINDRGPFADDRIIDLSQAAAEAVGLIGSGVAPVRLTLAGGPAGLRPLRVDPRLSGYDVIVPGAVAGELLVLRSQEGTEVLVRVVDLAPLVDADASGDDVWTSAGLAERLGAVATVALD